MEFVDSTGHIFSLPSYDDNPINLEYVEGDYIFWLKDSAVSINNYYIKPVRFLLDEKIIKDNFYIDDEGNNNTYFELEVSNSSQFYKLISPKYLQEQLEQNDSISRPVGLDKSQFKDKLTLDDFYFDLDGISSEEDTVNLVVTSGTSNNKFYMFPFYVVGYSEVEGTFLNNITIKYSTEKDKVRTVTKELSRDEYYDYILKKSISPIKIYQWDFINDQYINKRLVYTIKPEYKTQLIDNSDDEDAINGGLNKYEILYNGDGVEKDPDYPISNNVLSSLYPEDDVQQTQQKNRIRSTITNGENIVGQLPVEEYIYIYKLNHVLPQGYYTFEGDFYNSTSVLPLTRLPIPFMGFNHDGYRNSTNLDSLYPEDNGKEDPLTKFQCGTLEILNPEVIQNKNNYIIPEERTVKYCGYPISDESHLTTPIEYPQIRDFWFLLINKDINEGKNGRTVDNYPELIAHREYNYTPITVGCSFIDECEELIINGKNMGIRLPKEILKAIYNSSFYTKYADEKLLKVKLKEILLNYMNIKGETGNIKSMINSLKWFGWGNHIEISQLIKTDNRLQNQFILDNFSITSDIKDTFKYFNKTNNISLSVLYNTETGDMHEQDFDNTLIGEGKPVLENLFDKMVKVVKDDIIFYKPYYNFIFNELALKLDCLKYYYQQYFLPIHININRASVDYKVYANTTKMSSIGFVTMTDKPVYLPDDANNINVVFPDTNKLIFMQTQHLIDSTYNEFSNYNNAYTEEDLYYVNENCITIPIRIENNGVEYISDPLGNYIYENGEYIKINYFYKYTEIGYKLVNNIEDGSYYSIDYYSDIKPLENNRFIRHSKLFSKDEYGDYFIDENGDYVKMNFFYKIVDENNAVLSNKFEATHFSIEKNVDIQNLDDYVNNRYSNVSEGYFNCKIILTSTSFKQNDIGNYVFIDGKYIYRKEFYTQEITDDNIKDLYVFDSGNYIKYNDSFIRVDPKNRYEIETNYLIKDNNFNFYQSSKQYYSNLVVIPRLLKTDMDWENAHYRLSILVNNKWFNYDFDIVVPNIYLDLGKLEYKYTLTHGDNTYYPFKQLKSLSPLKFNSFMFEPDLITIDALFKDKNDKVLTFIDKLLETGIYDNNGQLVSSEMKMYEFYKKYYSNILKVPYNKKYYNRIHVFDIYDQNNDKVKYIDDKSDETILYQKFFNNNLTYKYQLNENVVYDYYLMHNDKEWYMVAISQYPIASYLDEEWLNIHDTEHDIKEGNTTLYHVVYANYSTDKFLVNRMNIIQSHGYNQFNKDDIIIVGVNNNDYQFNIDLNNKWSINKIYDVNSIFKIVSNTSLTIIPNNNIDNLYSVGYYNVILNYTINGLNNKEHQAIAQYRILDKYQDIKYPEIIEPIVEEETFDIKDTISDFSILYETQDGRRKITKEILEPELGYTPIGIKVMNKRYYGPEQNKSIYIGLKWLSTNNPDNGFSNSGSLNQIYNPKLGFYGIDIEGLKNYKFIAYKEPEHTTKIGIYDYAGRVIIGDTSTETERVFPQTDYIEGLSNELKNPDGTPKYPAPNNRAFHDEPASRFTINILNDNDTLNISLLDEDCAAYDWNGKRNTEIMIENFDESDPLFSNWRTSATIQNNYNDKRFSPVAACAWRYHTKSTHQGDWYLPSFAEVMCLTYNFKRLSELFDIIASKYPNDCKPDLLQNLYSGSRALWTSTEYNKYMMWEIHPNQHIHALRKSTSWNAFPYIQIDD